MNGLIDYRLIALLVIGMFPSPIPQAEAQQPQTQTNAAQLGAQIAEGMLQGIDPDLLKRAAEKGLYNREEYPVLRRMNPFFIRGDFNGDGAMDLAVWVTQRSSGLRGVVVIPSTLDTVYYLGAGHCSDDMNGTGKRGEVFADAWRVLPMGTVVQAFHSIREIGAVEGKPFTLRRETLQFHWLGKSSFVFYWESGRFWEVWTGD